MNYPVIRTVSLFPFKLSGKLVISGLTLVQFAQAQGPEVTSWLLNENGETGYGNIPSNVQTVYYTSNDVYVSCTCIPGYDIGPWTGNPNTPSNQDFTFKITRNPQENTGAPVYTSLGHIGVWSNGVSMYNPKDAFSYNNQGIWNQNAIVVEGISFDDCLGHPAPNGEYHTHLNPNCLYDDTDEEWHSPLIGFAFDGFPVYGAYGYANPDGSGGIVRMESSYALRNITQRHSLPDGSSLSANQYGPDVSNQFPLGYYIEDYEYVQNSGHLDEHNGRWCVTPEYPDGMYCYFVTVDANLEGKYPYIIGPAYYGTVQPGNTGPQSGHNDIPSDAVPFNNVGVIQNLNFPLVFRTLSDGWEISGCGDLNWTMYSLSGQQIESGASNKIPFPDDMVLPVVVRFYGACGEHRQMLSR